MFLSNSTRFQGPVVQEEHTGATTSGAPALLALLHHAHMYEHISLILNRYHAEDTVRSPAEIITDLPLDVGSLMTDSTVRSMAGRVFVNLYRSRKTVHSFAKFCLMY